MPRSDSCRLLREPVKRQEEERTCRLDMRAAAIERVLPAAHRRLQSKLWRGKQKPELLPQPALPIKQRKRANGMDSLQPRGDSRDSDQPRGAGSLTEKQRLRNAGHFAPCPSASQVNCFRMGEPTPNFDFPLCDRYSCLEFDKPTCSTQSDLNLTTPGPFWDRQGVHAKIF